ncbi:phage tail assembly chaperone G [Geomicrobium sp. JCM 19038]|uniref:phage tail assembly chaperone G n=1 Tax=Geomicrobium sp. JCM 19038 TaxID=1460635 RepID=UPI00045F397D|nr:hypothetical protein [Geomicrobium sp. JCM 19038]GAK09004.1 hypothetical protein JCM19038_2814 [Geomicrobium sp. JCM 19038]
MGLELNLYDEKGKKKETYRVDFISARHYRELMRLNSENDQMIDKLHFTDYQMDLVVDYVCTLFGSKFNVDDFYDGVNNENLFEEIVRIISFVNTGGRTPATEEEAEKKRQEKEQQETTTKS